MSTIIQPVQFLCTDRAGRRRGGNARVVQDVRELNPVTQHLTSRKINGMGKGCFDFTVGDCCDRPASCIHLLIIPAIKLVSTFISRARHSGVFIKLLWRVAISTVQVFTHPAIEMPEARPAIGQVKFPKEMTRRRVVNTMTGKTTIFHLGTIPVLS